MHPRTHELLDHLARNRAELRAAVDSVPVELRERRPAPERWSVAEVLEHLVIVENAVTDRFTHQVAAARADGLGPDIETAPVVPTLNVSFVLNRTHRIVAVEAARPRGTYDAEAAWTALEQSRERLGAALRDADGISLGTFTRPHPALGELNPYQWIAFVGAHEARHAAQIREIGAAVSSASRSSSSS